MTCPACGAANDEGADSCFRCGKSLYALTLGTVLHGRYEVRAVLGRGGMGTVYEAWDRDLEETIAVKVLRLDTGLTQSALKRFRSEIKLARRVRHRNVCAIHDYGEDGQFRYITMEKVEGTDLKCVVRERGALSVAEALVIAAQVADGLGAIHEAGIVHRDLKTPNVMIDTGGRVLLMDFGIAKLLEGEPVSAGTATGQLVGTPEYMSPEQIRGEKLDARSDLYALGVVLFELLSGAVPFRGDTPVSTLFKQVQEPPPLDGALMASIPPNVVGIVRQALEKDRTLRYGSAEEMAAALRLVFPDARARVPAPTAVLPAPAPPAASLPTVVEGRPTVPAAQRSSGLPVALVAALVVSFVALGAAGLWWTLAPAPGAPPPAVLVPPPPVTIGESVPSVASPVPEESFAPEPSLQPRPAMPRPTAEPHPLPTPTPRVATLPAVPIPAREPTPQPQPTSPATAEPVPTPAPPMVSVPAQPAPVPQAPGILALRIKPWAILTIDGRLHGKTASANIALEPGEHVLDMEHPKYETLRRVVTVRSGATVTLPVHILDESIRKK